MTEIRVIKHEAVPGCGSFEVQFSDGRSSRYYYWDDLPMPHLNPDAVDSRKALEKAQAFARIEQDKLDQA